MKKVLIIGYFWPYRGGSGRMLGLAKYLSEFGWQPTILTAPLETKADPRFKFIETPFPGDVFSFWRKIFSHFGFDTKKSITEQIKSRSKVSSQNSFADRLRTFYQEIFAFPDTEKSWRKPALKSARELLNKEKFDAIISVWPVTSHLIAKQVKRDYKIPWIADFPDPWTENHAYPYGKIRKSFDRKLEVKTIIKADAVTAASPGYAKKEESVNHRLVIAIPHGFDHETINDSVTPLTKNFTITYTGKIYTGKQDPEKILIAVKKLIDEGLIDSKKIEIRFYGDQLTWLDGEIEKNRLNNIAKQYGRLSKEEAIKKQRESQILLLLGWEDLKETGVYTLKTFEYLISKRPILLTGGSKEEDIKKILAETNAGESATTIEDIKKKLLVFYKEYEKTGAVSYHGDRNKIENYSYRSMAKKFSELLNKITRSDE